MKPNFKQKYSHCLGFQQFHALLFQELLYLLQFINITKANTHIAAASHIYLQLYTKDLLCII